MKIRYEADDGCLFKSEEDCLAYERFWSELKIPEIRAELEPHKGFINNLLDEAEEAPRYFMEHASSLVILGERVKKAIEASVRMPEVPDMSDNPFFPKST